MNLMQIFPKRIILLIFRIHKNNDSSNIIILCPNHHRLIHKLNPKFDYNRGCFVFSENSELRIELDFHLMK